MTKQNKNILQRLCIIILLGLSLAVFAQGEKTLVLTNYNSHPIWLDTVLYGDEEFPAGYLPPKGRIYLRLGTQEVRTLLLRWHKSKDAEQEQQTIKIKRHAILSLPMKASRLSRYRVNKHYGNNRMSFFSEYR